MGEPLDFVDEGGWPYPDDADTQGPEPIDLRFDVDDDLVALHALRRGALRSLSSVEREALTARFGLDGRAPMTMAELATDLGLSRSRTHAALAASLGKLRSALADDAG